MTKQKMFGDAVWLTEKSAKEQRAFVLRAHFSVKNAKKATLRVLGLGIFHCYINGKRVGDELFLPLNSEFEPRKDFPRGEILSGFRMYVPEYDVTDMLNDGDNVIAIHFGGGWYTYARERRFGEAKAIWRIFGIGDEQEFDFCSSAKDKIAQSFAHKCVSNVPRYSMAAVEEHDYTQDADSIEYGFDDTAWDNAIPAKEPLTDYLFSDCPKDKVCETLIPKLLYKDEEKRVYDAGKNTSGYPVLKIRANLGDKVSVNFSEELLDDGTPSPKFNHMQHFSVISDGTDRVVRPLFFWFGFRYFEVIGEAEVECVEVVHSDVRVSSSFESDCEILNWINKAFINTQLTNMHTGTPSDCPHLERRGYTGDGQLVCHAALNTLSAESFYRKWIEDIRDSQDKISGHVQYTAPYTHSGGGPGGWGSAIIEVPYQFYRHFGDKSVLEKYYPNMLHYFDFLEEHSERDFVVSDKEGEWCLGDWCTPQSVILPAPFVNNYFYIKSLQRMIKIATLIGNEADVAEFERRITVRKAALVNAYFNKWDGNFLGGVQAANAFMLDIGLGDERTYPNLVKRYEELGGFDTGIFGTDVLTRILFERGDAELAVRLLTSEALHSFAEMKRLGASTLWEYWPGSLNDRSHNHPMFGAVTAYLYDYLGGIREEDGSDTYQKFVIEPRFVSGINKLSCKRTLPQGEVKIEYVKENNDLDISVVSPDEAFLIIDNKRYPIKCGKNDFHLQI